ncbi:hypothetical protein HanPSC8_Chr17g0793181 [Helianthus annuus]|nr:hypothetical protein HanPSC8_Chr17g0793181 [Helianthus annuus]
MDARRKKKAQVTRSHKHLKITARRKKKAQVTRSHKHLKITVSSYELYLLY